MKNKKFSFNKLLQNNKFLLILALLISLSVWVYMSTGTSNNTTTIISDLPIQIELSDEAVDNGLQIFSGADQTASISVSGNRATVGSIVPSDISISATASAINSSGTYQLELSASKTNLSKDFQLSTNVTPSNITVVVDYLRESTFQIQENVVYKVGDGYYASTSLSAKSVVISGPQTKISKIAKVAAVASIDQTLSESASTEAKLVLYDENNKEISTDMLTMDMETVKATISVLPEKTVDVNPIFINKPEGLEITSDIIDIEPDNVLLAGPKAILDETSSVNLEVIDFSTLKNEKKTFPSLGIDIPTDCKNISNSTTAKVTLDLSSLSSKTFTVDKFSVSGLSKDYSAEVTQNSISVTIIGPKSELDDLSAGKITGVIDTADSKGTTGSVQMPVSFTISGTKSCWAYGSYKANLTITEK